MGWFGLLMRVCISAEGWMVLWGYFVFGLPGVLTNGPGILGCFAWGCD